jgi:general stress protein 13
MSKYKEGEIVLGCVTGIEKYGVFVNLDEYYSGLIHISEISSSFVRNIHDYVKIGETIKVKILEEDEQSHQVKLSIKDFDYRMGKKKNQKINETTSGFTTLKNILDQWIEEKYNEITKKN